MSRVVDNRVVEMEFDNSNFEKNVGTSLSTLDKLKAALSFKGTDKDFDAVESSVIDLGKSFSWMEQIGIGALRRLGDRIESWAESTVKSLTGVNNVITGFGKFSSMTESTGVLKAQGYAIEEVNSELERLLWFSDETSYEFSDMVNNIAKFTATGQGLKDSADAMMGIALWAALSGKGATQASSAMYQLAQALGAGVMRKEDWKSIQNLNMNTLEFEQHALDAAVALKTLKKNSDGTYTSLVATGKAGAEAFSIEQFAERLTEGQWFTKDVMMKVFREYSAGVQQIYDYTEEHGVTARQAMDALGDQVDAFGKKAFEAGQKTQTWEALINSVKDAASTGWMTAFQNLFGGYEDVVKFFSDLADQFYDLFVEPINKLNDVLAKWGEKGGRSKFIQSIYNIVSAVENMVWVFRHVFNKIVYGTTKKDAIFGIRVDTLLKITDAVESFTEKLADTIRNSLVFRRYLRAFLTIFDMAWQIVKGFYDAVKDTFSGTGKVIQNVIEKLSYVIREFYYLGKRTKANKSFYKIFSTALKPIKNLKDYLFALYKEALPEFERRWNNLKEILKDKFEDPFEKLKESLDKIFDTIIGAWKRLFGGRDAKNDAEKLFKIWDKIKGVFYDISGLQPGEFIDKVAEGIDKLAEKIEGLNQWLTTSDVETGLTGLETIEDRFKKFKDDLKKMLGPIWKDVKKALKDALSWIKDNWDSIWGTLKDIGNAVWGFLSSFWTALTGFFTQKDAKEGTSGIVDFLDVLKNLGSVLGTVVGAVSAALKPLADGLKNTLESLSLDNAGEFLKGGGLAALGVAFYRWSKGFGKGGWFKGFSNVLDSIGKVLDGFTKLLDAKALKEAAIGIAILVASLLILISIPADDLTRAATVMALIIEILADALKKLTGFKTSAAINAKGFSFSKSGAGSTIFMAALAFVALAAVLKIIAAIPEKDLYRAATVVAVMTGILTMMMKAIAKIYSSKGDTSKTKIKNSNNLSVGNGLTVFKTGPGATILAFAVFVAAVVFAIKKISDMLEKNEKTFYASLAVAAGIMVALGVFLGVVGKFYKQTETKKGTIKSPSNSLWKNIIGIAAGIYIVAMAFEKIATIKSTGNRLLGAGVFILLFMASIAAIAKYSQKAKFEYFGRFARGVVVLTLALGIVLGVMVLLANSDGNIKDAYVSVAIIGLVFAGLAIVGKKFTTEKMVDRFVKFSAALVIIASGILIASAALYALSEIDSSKIGNAITLLLVIFGALALAGVIGSTPYLGGGLVKFSEAMVLLAGAVALVGLGFLAAAEGVKIFSDSQMDAKKAADNITQFIDEIVKKIPQWATDILTALIGTLIAALPASLIAFVDALSTTLAALTEKDEVTGEMKIEKLVSSAIKVVLAVIDGITNNMAEIVASVGKMVVSLLTELGSWVQTNKKDISDAISSVVDGLIDIILELFAPLGEKIFGEAWDGENGIATLLKTTAKYFFGFTVVSWVSRWVFKIGGVLGSLSLVLTGIMTKIASIIAAHPVLTGIVAGLGAASYLVSDYNSDEDRRSSLMAYADKVAGKLGEDAVNKKFAELMQYGSDLRYENGYLVGKYADEYYTAHPNEDSYYNRKGLSIVVESETLPNGEIVFEDVGVKSAAKHAGAVEKNIIGKTMSFGGSSSGGKNTYVQIVESPKPVDRGEIFRDGNALLGKYGWDLDMSTLTSSDNFGQVLAMFGQ